MSSSFISLPVVLSAPGLMVRNSLRWLGYQFTPVYVSLIFLIAGFFSKKARISAMPVCPYNLRVLHVVDNLVMRPLIIQISDYQYTLPSLKRAGFSHINGGACSLSKPFLGTVPCLFKCIDGKNLNIVAIGTGSRDAGYSRNRIPPCTQQKE